MTASVELLPIPMPVTPGRVDIYSGVARLAGKIWASRHRAGPGRADTAVVVVHPSSNFLGHYALPLFAEMGFDAIGLNTRYIANDSALIMENCVLDVGAAIRFLRDEGYERIALMGNSGGGGLAAFYQSQAEHPTVSATPAGDPPDLRDADLPPADALVEFMAHPGRAIIYTEWLDPAIKDEQRPFDRDPDLDIFDERNGPPFTGDFLERFRAAQHQRSNRITTWVREQLDALAADGRLSDLPFVVHGTCADPRFLDMTLEPNDREPGTLWGEPYAANYLPASLGHHTSLRSWLSQWSIAESNCDGPKHLGAVSAPVLVVYGTADQTCYESHARSMYDAVTHEQRELIAISGATHYFAGQPELAHSACEAVYTWLSRLAD